MLPQISQTLSDQHISPEEAVVAGVSGGADSLCLLHYLVGNGYRVVVAHLDHSLRPDSGSDAEFVRDFGKKLGCEVVIKVSDVQEYARQAKLSIEEAARKERYRFLFEVAEEKDAQAVVVAHHADDQVETVLMHILRGSGLAGMRGMQVSAINPSWSAHIPLVRPLLGVWRKDILQYCEDNGISPRVDESNQDTTYFRNRLRHELLPALESYNPNIREGIWRLADTAAEDFEVLETVVDQAWSTCIVGEGEGYVSLYLEKTQAHPVSVQRALLRRAIAILRPGLRDIDYAAVERARSFIQAPSSTGQVDLIDGLKLEIDGQCLVVAEWEALRWQPDWPRITGKRYLNIPGSLDLPDGWVIEAEVMDFTPELLEQVRTNNDDFQAWLDGNSIDQPLFARAMKTGDKFAPLGMKTQRMKVGDFFTNVKLAQRARPEWPLVFDQIGLLWIPGYRIDHRLRLTETSRLAVRLRMYRK